MCGIQQYCDTSTCLRLCKIGIHRISGLGQSRRFGSRPVTSSLSHATDIIRPARQVRSGSIASFCPSASHFRSPPINGHRQSSPVGPFRADNVVKVENRTTPKISRKLIFRLLCCCLAIQRRYEGPWSISDGSIWSLTSPRVKRISGSKNFRSTPQKDFCNMG